MELQRVPLGSRYPWGLNLLMLDTVAVKEVTKEGRDVSGLGSREVLVVRDVLHVHALQVRILWRTETKKQRIDLILGVPIRISLGAKLAALKTFYTMAGSRGSRSCAYMFMNVHPGIVIRRKEVCCSSSLSHHTQLAGAWLRGRTTRSLQELVAGN